MVFHNLGKVIKYLNLPVELEAMFGFTERDMFRCFFAVVSEVVDAFFCLDAVD